MAVFRICVLLPQRSGVTLAGRFSERLINQEDSKMHVLGVKAFSGLTGSIFGLFRASIARLDPFTVPILESLHFGRTVVYNEALFRFMLVWGRVVVE